MSSEAKPEVAIKISGGNIISQQYKADLMYWWRLGFKMKKLKITGF
jgi:predicted transcriptional regulator